MAVNIKTSAGTDLDDIFEPHRNETAASATNYKDSLGNDLNLRYYNLAQGGSAPAATGYRLSTSADLNTVFASLGSPTPGLNLVGTHTLSAPGGAGYLVGVTVASTGKLDLVNTFSLPTDPTDQWLEWYPDTTTAALYEATWTLISQSGPGTRTSPAAAGAWVNCSTSPAWTLQGTNPTWVFTLTIREKLNTSNTDSCTIDLSLSV